MKVFHLSHIDLDGYGCQLVSREFFKDITFYNANYGREVSSRLNTILDTISSYKKNSSPTAILFGKPVQVIPSTNDNQDSKQKFIILITDLNLTTGESKFLNEQVANLKLANLDIDIILLDHHATGEESAELYNWYYLDVNRCATKITYEYLLDRFGLESKVQDWLKPTVEMINSVDIWLEDGFGFEFGKVAMSMIATSNEINRFMFDIEHRKYKFDLLQQTSHFLKPYDSKYGGLIDGRAFDEVGFDNELFFLKKTALGGNKETETMDNIVSRALVKLLEERKEKCKVFYEDKIGFLSYCMGGISVVANLFLQNNAEFDFYIDVSNRGNVSLRSNGKCDVSLISQSCFNGGGHKNASGGRMDGFKESFVYDDIKSQVQGFLEMQNEWDL